MIPSAPIYEISKSKITQLTLEQEVDSSDVKLGDDDSIQKKWSEMFENMHGPKATGKFHQMFAAPPIAAMATFCSSPSSIAALSSGGGFLGGGDALGLSFEAVQKESEEEEGAEESSNDEPENKRRKRNKDKKGSSTRTGGQKRSADAQKGGDKGTTPKTRKGGPGRPKRDAVSTGMAWLQEVVTKSRSHATFTTEALTESRWLKRPCDTFINGVAI